MRIIKKVYTREFPLILCEIWGKAYKHFLGRNIKTFPRNIFVIKNGLVDNYRSEDLYKELNNLFYEKVKADPKYFEQFYKEYLKKFQDLEKEWNQSFLEKKKLSEFAKKMVEFWPAIYATIHVPQTKEMFSKNDVNLMSNLRKEVDIAADKATHVILASLHHYYPELGSLVNYVTLIDLDKKKIDIDHLKRLSQKKLIMVDNRFVNNKEFQDLKKRYKFSLEEIKVEKEINQFKGQVACRGYAKGNVRLILKREEISNFQEGDVLVSSMTVPDYLPAMEKAAAFITDEGGITCHAAIVSREMKKPCVIGTKIATKVLKNGDLVEVDANKGIIKKIK